MVKLIGKKIKIVKPYLVNTMRTKPFPIKPTMPIIVSSMPYEKNIIGLVSFSLPSSSP